jgi:hypothetical protein
MFILFQYTLWLTAVVEIILPLVFIEALRRDWRRYDRKPPQNTLWVRKIARAA